MELTDKVAIITGGGTGIGRASALLMAKLGAKVVVCGRRSAPLLETAQLIEQEGGKALALPADVRNSTEVREMVGLVVKHFERIDILLNNAGIALPKPAVEVTEEEWDNILDTNLKGVFLCCQAVLPGMLAASQGVIINVSSILGLAGIANWGPYCAAKFGLLGLTQAWAEELKPKGIEIFTVCPGRTNTEMQRRVGGARIAELSMPPDKVAAKIVGLARGEIRLPSGSAIVVDEQSPRLAFYETKVKGGQIARRWFTPTLPILDRLRQMLR
jgi:NAD(P)-dependent dehydrogenase (short-subunit alcohol dehydrogenase family)